MKAIAMLIVCTLLGASDSAFACGTPTPSVQAKIHAEESVKLRQLANETAESADAVFIGTVTALKRPSHDMKEFGSAVFANVEILKGDSPRANTVQWHESVVLSCMESAMFLNVGFREGGKYIVYVRRGKVIRAAAADHLRSGQLTLQEERDIAVRASSR